MSVSDDFQHIRGYNLIFACVKLLICCRSTASPRLSTDDLDKANLEKQIQSQSSQEQKKSSQHASGNPVKNYVLEQLAKLMTTCMIIKIDDFTIYKVTSSTRKPTTKEFIAGNRMRGIYFLYLL